MGARVNSSEPIASTDGSRPVPTAEGGIYRDVWGEHLMYDDKDAPLGLITSLAASVTTIPAG
jgi:hypothetical protein